MHPTTLQVIICLAHHAAALGVMILRGERQLDNKRMLVVPTLVPTLVLYVQRYSLDLEHPNVGIATYCYLLLRIATYCYQVGTL